MEQLGESDVVIVGAGIAGLANALAAARRGLSVVVVERGARATGASVRNFGMVWPVGQGAESYELAMRGRGIWLELAERAGFWAEEVGSLHLAYRDDERAVLEEYYDGIAGEGRGLRLCGVDEVGGMAAGVRVEGLQVGLYSPSEVAVDPREALAVLPGYLEKEYGVRFLFSTVVIGIAMPEVETSRGRLRAGQVVVCGGSDLETLYPEIFDGGPLVRCKLQMMRTVAQPGGWRMGPMLAGGLTLGHYAAFAPMRSLAALKRRFSEEMSEYVRWGIHVMANQNGRGELVLGDSHSYGEEAEQPFDREEIDRLVLDYLGGFLCAPDLRIAERWHGVYAKNYEGLLFDPVPAPGVRLFTGLSGMGMTLSFGLAEEMWEQGMGGAGVDQATGTVAAVAG